MRRIDWLAPTPLDLSDNNVKERPLRSCLLALLVCVMAIVPQGHAAETPSTVKIATLKFGTVSWMLDTIQANGLDKAEGIELDIVPLASTQATTVGHVFVHATPPYR